MEKTVNYIQELLKKKLPMQTLTGLGRDSVPKITLHYYPKDSALREPHSTSEDQSQEELPEEFPDFNTVEELKQWLGIDDNTPSPSPALLANPPECTEEELIADFNTTEEELIADFNLELLGSPAEELPEVLGSPEFNWTEDFRQYLEL
jgi:hypothetical protein